MQIGYRTAYGTCYMATAEDLIRSRAGRSLRGGVNLIFTSPPFPLNRKKKYGNLQGQAYIDWLAALAEPLRHLLTEDGSIVMEMGNSWEPGMPAMSTLALEAMLAFLRAGNLCLCQQFVWHNPARLPVPAQWVNVERIRVKDAFTNVWWMAPSERPKADNRRILKPYSKSMETLLRTGKYNAGVRPSEHRIGDRSFLRDNSGAIPSNVITIANTRSRDPYLDYCRQHSLPRHPARMPIQLAEFFLNFLTEPGDLVVDPFAGSNVTGAVAEKLGRRWLAVEPEDSYVSGSKGRFDVARAEDQS